MTGGETTWPILWGAIVDARLTTLQITSEAELCGEEDLVPLSGILEYENKELLEAVHNTQVLDNKHTTAR